jgi:serine-type D-Ala-D-Ala carboxypeptidase/endopeptidase (penicillin-binding protein 4)
MLLKAISVGVVSLVSQVLQPQPAPDIIPYRSLTWQDAPVFAVSYQDDPQVQQIVSKYVAQLQGQGKNRNLQGVWIQSNWLNLGNHQGTIPLSAASLTKVATTLAALDAWSLEHQFETKLYVAGAVSGGVVNGDLIVEGGGNPLFVWEEAIALGNALNQTGIREVQGNLVVVGNFSMNYAVDPVVSAQTLRMGMDQRLWNGEARGQYNSIPDSPPKPQVSITGGVLRSETIPTDAKLVLTHQSLPLSEILKLMNIYSNNSIAEAIAQNLGGGTKIGQKVAQELNIPSNEIQLINGSGLGVDNRISPRAVVTMFQAIEQRLIGNPLAISDLFPVSGRDKRGTMKDREMPKGIIAKTGTLNQVSALAGMIPTSEHGNVWFAIINNGTWDVRGYRAQQDQLLQTLDAHWQLTPLSSMLIDISKDYFGNPNRIDIETSPS